MEKIKYDVAISFLVRDITLATALRDKLSESLRVFFFSHNQEDLAGTDGLESMRTPFLEESLLNVVLYRKEWGHTPWTGVEEAAIKDSCLKCSFRNVFFFMIEPQDEKPVWLPDTPVRFNYGEFSIEQAIGAIKSRVQERGGHFQPMTPQKKADQLRSEQKYQRGRTAMESDEGIRRINAEVEALMHSIATKATEAGPVGGLVVESEATAGTCILRYQRVGMIVRWHQRWSNSLEESALTVEEYNEHLLFNREVGQYMQFDRPKVISSLQFEADLSRSFEYGWCRKEQQERRFISPPELVDQCVIQFLDLVQRDLMGKVQRRSRY